MAKFHVNSPKGIMKGIGTFFAVRVPDQAAGSLEIVVNQRITGEGAHDLISVSQLPEKRIRGASKCNSL